MPARTPPPLLRSAPRPRPAVRGGAGGGRTGVGGARGRRRRRPGIALLVVLALGPAWAGGWLLPGIDDVAEPNPALASGLHAAADAARAAHGLAGTAWDEGLARAARQHAAELAARGVLDHASPTPGRHTVADRLARAGSPYAHHGENLARIPDGLDPVSATVDGWLASPPHRANLLHAGFDRVGFGTARDAGGRVYVVLVLAGAPWAPSLAQATVAPIESVRITLGLRVERATRAWIEVAGAGAAVDLAAGFQRHALEVSPPGPWSVRIGLPGTGAHDYLLDEAGSLANSGRWRPADAPRRGLRVTAGQAETLVRERVRLRLEVPAAGAALLVDGRHLPAAAPAAGILAVDLDLADGASVRLGLAEDAGNGLLRVVHGLVLRRSGATVTWAARP